MFRITATRSVSSLASSGRRCLAIALVGAAAVAPAAHAEGSSSSVPSLKGYVECDFGTHRTAAGANILLDQARFPNGAYFALRYFTWGVNSSLRRNTPLHYTGWGRGFMPAQTVWHDSYLTGSFSTVQPFMTADTWLYRRGAFRVGVQVGVWNGSDYEYTTTAADSYVVKHNGYRISPSSGTYCRG
jgi:hypothetical protein